MNTVYAAEHLLQALQYHLPEPFTLELNYLDTHVAQVLVHHPMHHRTRSITPTADGLFYTLPARIFTRSHLAAAKTIYALAR